MRRKKLLRIIPLAIVGIALFIAVGGALVMQLWNWLMPALFGFRIITFWQAFGILVLCRVLFGGLGRHGHMHSNFRRRMGERCGRMSEEERERFRQKMRETFGAGATASESKS
jgi:uncharacterized membrane protein